MSRPNLVRVGGFAGVVFCTIWVFCGVGYVVIAGIPSHPASLADTTALLRSARYQLLFWLWPIAYLAIVPFALGAREHLRNRSPLWADLGSAFLFLYGGVWFVFHATVMLGIGFANADPVDEAALSMAFSITGVVVAPLFWFIALFEISWGLALLRGSDSRRGLAIILFVGAALSLVYFVMRLTGPMFAAELIHEGLILCMVLGVAALSHEMLGAESTPTSK